MSIEPVSFFLKSPSESGIRIREKPAVGDLAEADDPDKGDFLLCMRCGNIIARSGDRMAVEGAHCHTFANPHGIVFEIGCFSPALGCGAAGPATDEFSWFKGRSWKVAYCRRCRIHLGWWFGSDAGGEFYGLILDRLIESGKGNDSPASMW